MTVPELYRKTLTWVVQAGLSELIPNLGYNTYVAPELGSFFRICQLPARAFPWKKYCLLVTYVNNEGFGGHNWPLPVPPVSTNSAKTIMNQSECSRRTAQLAIQRACQEGSIVHDNGQYRLPLS
jgi:hypothetical protein